MRLQVSQLEKIWEKWTTYIFLPFFCLNLGFMELCNLPFIYFILILYPSFPFYLYTRRL